jgi:predicted dehydrogenase
MIYEPRQLALITPAKSHPEVIIQAVSARDRKRAEAFAKSHSIPEVRDSYEGELSPTANQGELLTDMTRYYK